LADHSRSTAQLFLSTSEAEADMAVLVLVVAVLCAGLMMAASLPPRQPESLFMVRPRS
jgi:hypothetical protein